MVWDDRESKLCVVRLKREDCNRTKHDSLFSPWKVLIGPFDWKDHSTGKEGVDRYRVHNLPNSTSCSGIYELGIVLEKASSGRETSKLDKNYILPVYIGQADNVRNRMQQYGREGAHLERGKLNGNHHDDVHQGPRLFSSMFSRGYSVVFRWAPMENKSDAEKAEAQLLDTFDYAWNKGSNGIRRPNDIHKRLDKIALQNTIFLNVATKLRIFRPKKLGIKIKPCNTDFEENNLFSRIFKIGRSRPKNVSSRFDLYKGTTICGVALGQGSVCLNPPIEGRKRCDEHKGMKINGISSKLKFENNIHNNELIPVCGITLEDGYFCDKRPVKGRKRCEEHKGRRITELSYPIASGNCDEIYKTNECDRLESIFGSEKVIVNKIETSCGVNLSDGKFCTNSPVRGRKRCTEHKGMRITKSEL